MCRDNEQEFRRQDGPSEERSVPRKSGGSRRERNCRQDRRAGGGDVTRASQLQGPYSSHRYARADGAFPGAR